MWVLWMVLDLELSLMALTIGMVFVLGKCSEYMLIYTMDMKMDLRLESWLDLRLDLTIVQLLVRMMEQSMNLLWDMKLAMKLDCKLGIQLDYLVRKLKSLKGRWLDLSMDLQMDQV